jgi:hypothetical protein
MPVLGGNWQHSRDRASNISEFSSRQLQVGTGDDSVAEGCIAAAGEKLYALIEIITGMQSASLHLLPQPATHLASRPPELPNHGS